MFNLNRSHYDKVNSYNSLTFLKYDKVNSYNSLTFLKYCTHLNKVFCSVSLAYLCELSI